MSIEDHTYGVYRQIRVDVSNVGLAYGDHALTFSSGRAVTRNQHGPGLHRDVGYPTVGMVYWSERYGLFRRFETNELITRRRRPEAASLATAKAVEEVR